MTMQTNDNHQLFLDMQEHPENYTDSELEAMMDELDREPDVDKEWKKIGAPLLSPQRVDDAIRATSSKRGIWRSPLRRIAAVLIPILIASGIAWAIIPQLISHNETDEQDMETNSIHETDAHEAEATPVRFNDVRLDSILDVVATHYGKAVEFRSSATRGMKFFTTWKPDRPLADFIEGLNMFDGLQLTIQHDTIFVDAVAGKEDAE